MQLLRLQLLRVSLHGGDQLISVLHGLDEVDLLGLQRLYFHLLVPNDCLCLHDLAIHVAKRLRVLLSALPGNHSLLAFGDVGDFQSLNKDELPCSGTELPKNINRSFI